MSVSADDQWYIPEANDDCAECVSYSCAVTMSNLQFPDGIGHNGTVHYTGTKVLNGKMLGWLECQDRVPSVEWGEDSDQPSGDMATVVETEASYRGEALYPGRFVYRYILRCEDGACTVMAMHSIEPGSIAEIRGRSAAEVEALALTDPECIIVAAPHVVGSHTPEYSLDCCHDTYEG